MDPRFSHFQTATQTGTFYPVKRTAPNLTEVYRQWQHDVKAAEEIAGRELTADELRHGLPKTESRTEIERRRAEFQFKAQLDPPAPPKTPEQRRLESAKQRAENERRELLTPAQRELEDATLANQAAEAKAVRQAEAAKIRASATYQNLRKRLDDLLFVAKFDSSVPPAIVEQLQHQSNMLEKFLDVPATSSNVDTIQRVARKGLEAEQLKLKAQIDAVALRQKLLSAGQVFDAIAPESAGGMEFVALTVGGRTVKVSKERYESRVSDESLKTELFGGEN